MSALSKGFYLGSIVVAGGLSIILSAVMQTEYFTIPTESSIILLSTIQLSFYVEIVFCILWYKAWASIQVVQARTRPGKAMGFLFITVLYIFWLF